MDFQSLPRKDLQALCKKNGIPANITSVAMVQKLSALEVVLGLEEVLGEPASQKQPSPVKETRTQKKTLEASEIAQSISRPRRVTRSNATDQEEDLTAGHEVSTRKKTVETHKQDNIADASAPKGVSTRKGDPRTAKKTRIEVETVDMASNARRSSRRIADASNQMPSDIVKRTPAVNSRLKKAAETERLDEEVSVKRGCTARRLATKSKDIKKKSNDKMEEDEANGMEIAVKLNYEENLEHVSEVPKEVLDVIAEDEDCVETVDTRRVSRRIADASNQMPSDIVKRTPAVSSRLKKAAETERLNNDVKKGCTTRRPATKSKDIKKKNNEKMEEDEAKGMEIEAVKLNYEENLEYAREVPKEALDVTAENEDCLEKEGAIKEEIFDEKMVEEAQKEVMDVSAGNEDELEKGLDTSTLNENENKNENDDVVFDAEGTMKEDTFHDRMVEAGAVKEQIEVLDMSVDEQGVKEEPNISFQFEGEHLNMETNVKNEEEIDMSFEEPYEKKMMEECEKEDAPMEEECVSVQIESGNVGSEFDIKDDKLDKSDISVQTESENLQYMMEDKAELGVEDKIEVTELGVEAPCDDFLTEEDKDKIEVAGEESENPLIENEDESDAFVRIESKTKSEEQEDVDEIMEEQEEIDIIEGQEHGSVVNELDALDGAQEDSSYVNEEEQLDEAQEDVSEINEHKACVQMGSDNLEAIKRDDISALNIEEIHEEKNVHDVTEKHEATLIENEDESDVPVEMESGNLEDKKEENVEDQEDAKIEIKSESDVPAEMESANLEDKTEVDVEEQEDELIENEDEANVPVEGTCEYRIVENEANVPVEGTCEYRIVENKANVPVEGTCEYRIVENKANVSDGTNGALQMKSDSVDEDGTNGNTQGKTREAMETVVSKIDEIVEKLTDTANMCTNCTALEKKDKEALTLGDSIRIFEESIESYQVEMELCSDEEDEAEKNVYVYEDKREIILMEQSAPLMKKKGTDKENHKGLKEMSLRKLRKQLKMHTANKEHAQVDTHRVPLQALPDNI